MRIWTKDELLQQCEWHPKLLWILDKWELPLLNAHGPSAINFEQDLGGFWVMWEKTAWEKKIDGCCHAERPISCLLLQTQKDNTATFKPLLWFGLKKKIKMDEEGKIGTKKTTINFITLEEHFPKTTSNGKDAKNGCYFDEEQMLDSIGIPRVEWIHSTRNEFIPPCAWIHSTMEWIHGTMEWIHSTYFLEFRVSDISQNSHLWWQSMI